MASYERVETSEPKEEAPAPAASNGNGRAYQTSTVSSSASNLTANQMAHLAEYDELNMFRDGVFECTDNVYPSCFLSFLCPYVHAGQLARRLQVAPCWLPPLVLFAVFGVVVFFDSPLTEAIYFATWAGVIFTIRLKVRRYFRPNPGMLGDFSQLPGHLDDCCLGLWCGCCAIAQLSRHIGNYKLHGTSCSHPTTQSALDDGDALV